MLHDKMLLLKDNNKNTIGLSYKGYTAKSYSKLTIKELLQAKKDIDKKVSEDLETDIKYQAKKRAEQNFKKLLDSISKKDYLTQLQVLDLIKKIEVYYAYGLISYMELYQTKNHTLKGMDAKNNVIYFNQKKYSSYKFYKDNFVIVGGIN